MRRERVGKDISIPSGFTRPEGKVIFNKETIYENSCSWNHEQKIQEFHAGELMSNLIEKRAELTKKAVERFFGGVGMGRPSKGLTERLSLVKFDGDASELSWLFVDQHSIAVFTDFKSRITENKYYLGFRFLELTGEQN